jgi:LCP family protein required for cell wall assembly
MPVSENSIGQRKEKTATILLCGTDKDGTRTDTMMLVYLDGAENRVGLLSLPRDTLTRTSEGKRAKLNSAYGRNGCGEEGMEWTLNYIQRIIGYRPDGYILVDMELVPKIVDLMGGVDVHLDHHIRVHTDGVEVYVPAGDAHLNGEEVLATLRYRYGYADADLGRVKVQRMVITECMKQWVSPAKLPLLPDALELIQEESLTDLSVGNFLWIGKTILAGMNDMTSDTLPGYADMRGGASYFVLYPDQVAELINESYNPYTVAIDVDDLNIAE